MGPAIGTRWRCRHGYYGTVRTHHTVDRQTIEAFDKSLITNIILPDCRGSSESMASNCRSGYYTVTVRTLATDRLEGYAERGSGPQGRPNWGRAKTWKVPIERMLFPRRVSRPKLLSQYLFLVGVLHICCRHSSWERGMYPGWCAPPSLLMTKEPSAHYHDNVRSGLLSR